MVPGEQVGRVVGRCVLLTAQLVQGLLRVGVSVTALPDVAGLQLHAGPDRGDWLVAGLQVHAGKQGEAARARLVFNSLVEPLKQDETHIG